MSDIFESLKPFIYDSDLKKNLINLVVQVQDEFSHLTAMPVAFATSGNQGSSSLAALEGFVQEWIMDKFPKPLAVTVDELITSLLEKFQSADDEASRDEAFELFRGKLYFDLGGAALSEWCSTEHSWLHDESLVDEETTISVGSGFSVRISFASAAETEEYEECFYDPSYCITCNSWDALQEHHDDIEMCVLTFFDTCHRAASSIEKTAFPKARRLLSCESRILLRRHVSAYFGDTTYDNDLDNLLDKALRLVTLGDFTEEPLEQLTRYIDAISLLVCGDGQEEIDVNTAALLVPRKSDRELARQHVISLFQNIERPILTGNVEEAEALADHARSLAAGVVFATFEWSRARTKDQKGFSHREFLREISTAYTNGDKVTGVSDLSSCVIPSE